MKNLRNLIIVYTFCMHMFSIFSQSFYILWFNLRIVEVKIIGCVIVYLKSKFNNFREMESNNNSDSDCCITMYKEGDDIITFPKAETNESSLNRRGLFIKPGIQERGTECGECGERGECLLGFRISC